MKIYLIDQKSIYRQFCQEKEDMAFYFKDWWMDLVCGEKYWDVILSQDSSGRMLGVLPFAKRKMYGFEISRMPMLSPYIGIMLFYPNQMNKQRSRYAFEMKVSGELIKALSKLDFYNQYYSPDFTNIIPLHQQGFTPVGMSTYVLNLDQTKEKLLDQMDSTVRNKIRKGEENFKVVKLDKIEQLIDLTKRSFKENNSPYERDVILSIDETLKKKEKRHLYFAQDMQGNFAAGIYIIHDQNKIYSLMIGSDPAYRKGGAVQLLIWEVIQEWVGKVELLDFCGSIIQNIEPVFRGFGATQKPYFKVNRVNHPILKLVNLFMGK